MYELIPLQSGAGGAALLVLLLFVVTIGLVVWTYLDAEKHSSHPAFLWAVVVFLAPLLGIVLYFLLGRDQRHAPTGTGAAR